MNFGQAIASGFRNYVNFLGRSARSEYWWWSLFIVLVLVVAIILDILIFPNPLILESRAWPFPDPMISPIASLVWLALVIPTIAVTVRRFHDLDHRGWWTLLYHFVFVAVWFWKGTVGPNRFGPDPLAG